ncbi:MAG: HlyD family efflux transporter periplasmic adaptor subunit [Candidatus Eisenbacteria bacterium]|uniref:HlyD family efflux transporter periplasmic adaptor subunit n=1 Tax=Eiseniibacteriota bacterium TaxID=2212470 RepID=A0A538TTA2_UNCEI|nr:MAG: HlyD family efflux transporter periplasmic adaptor subunit [Candidatus Eisenbacteria bacterium]
MTGRCQTELGRPPGRWLRVAGAFAALGMIAASIGCGRDPGVHASGIIEMDEIDVASLVGGRVARLTVGEGDTVRAGDTLAVLDREEIAAEVRAQDAQAERAAAQSREVTTGPRREEIRAARASLASAEAALVLADRERTRAEKLFQDQVLPQVDLDRARASRDQALARRDTAREQLRLLEAGSRREQIVAARAAASAARANLGAARSRLDELILTAPVSGVVLLKNFEIGELAAAGQPVLTLGNPDRLWMRVYVAAPILARVRLGAPVEIRATGLDSHRFLGRVVEIATHAEFTPRVALTEEERANLVFGVKIALDPTGGVLKAGLPADVVIQAPFEKRRG